MPRELLEKRALDSDTTGRIWGGSIAAGAGIGLLGILYDAVRSQRRKAKAMTGSEPGALYIDLPGPEKQALLWEPLVGYGLGGATAYGIYEFYKKWKQEQLRKEIDEAAGGYTQSLYTDDLPDKTAGAFWRAVKDAPYDAFVLPGLAAGVGTYGLLEHTFPRVKEKKVPGAPKKIIVRGYGRVKVDGPGDGPLAEDDKKKAPPLAPPDPVDAEIPAEEVFRKAASFEFSDKDHRKAAELLCLSLASHPDLKEASSPMLELLGSYAGDPEGIRTAIKEAGMLGAISAGKGSAEVFGELSELDKRATVHRALRDPLVSPGLATLMIAEYNEVSPGHAKMAFNVAQDPDLLVLVTKFASVFHVLETGTWLADNQVEKTASYADFMDDASDNLGTLDLASYADSDGKDRETSPEELYRGDQDPIDKLMASK